MVKMFSNEQFLRMKELISLLNNYTELYDKGTPAISDAEWDKLYFELVKLEELTGEYHPNSPTRKINFTVKTKLDKVTHNHPMLSLAKTKDIDELKSFVNGRQYIAMLKMDGLTCSLHYQNGKLIGAETRGNGIEGEDILHNIMTVSGVPHAISIMGDVVIDGEVICDYESFKAFENEYANPRNFAAGSIRLLDNAECNSRCLTFVAWDYITSAEAALSRSLSTLEEIGFIVVPFVSTDGVDALEGIINSLRESAKTFDYPYDGIVVKYDDREYYNSLGRTDHHFKGGIAFKFYDEEYETELLDIEWSMGRTGQLTPVAIFKPLDVEGSTVERASLHNLSVMNSLLGIHPYRGQKIKIFKANEIIPQVSWGDTENVDYDNLIKCTCCPICGGDLEIRDNAGVITVWCANPSCEGKFVNVVDHFVGKKGLDVKGLSKATIEKLVDLGWLNKRSDVFNLYTHAIEWKTLSGFGEKSVSNILNAIEDSKNCTLEAFIGSLGIPLIGRTYSKTLAETFKTYADFRKAINNFEFYNIQGFGIEMHNAIVNYDYTEADEIAEMLHFQDESTSDAPKQTSATGKTFVITGTLSRARDAIKTDIVAAGGKVTGSVSGKTDYLVCNDKNSTTGKSKDAKDKGIPVINESELMQLLSCN